MGKNHLLLNKTLEWTLNWCILQSMFDRNFFVKASFISNPSLLKKRLMAVGLGMLLLSPFIFIFMLVYLFLRHAEQFYNHPSTASSRRWSNLSKWMFREFNEVDHLFKHRINSSIPHASDYLKQFPSPIVTIIAKFITFVSGGFAAILIIIAFLEESLLEGQIYGRNLLWYAAVFGTVTAISRAVVTDELQVLDPEGAMSLVVRHTHYMPKRWRCNENSDVIRADFETLFQYTGMMLLEEMASILLTPYLLLFVVPTRVGDILQFISDFTVDVEGVGHVCSFSVFDFERHGNRNYGSPHNAPRTRRSSQGKMEKSFLSFQGIYPTWEPDAQGKDFLSNLRNFREQKLQLRTTQTHLHPLTRQFAPNFRDQGYIARDVFYDNTSTAPITGYQMGSMWLIDPDQKNYPYLLDWYYTSRPSPSVNTSPVEVSTSPDEVTINIGDLWINNPTQREERFEENWGFPTEERLQSHFGASSSTPNFRESMIRHHNPGDPGHPTESHWWVRGGPDTAVPQASFLEPPTYGRPTDAAFYDNSDRISEEHEQCLDWRNSHILSKTFYINDSEADGDFNLPFNDIYHNPLENLSTRQDSMRIE
ncbi:hypothetical protein IFM89_000892 [Coptis chinensis]|uniref:Autophagy-related protein 9 n=1 Tax=Coptis chinensis TaxID=261450 RepID=A0A835IL43_9MAGN|nr:hypothetical protein IFM89_000892 [Coptis chinensis]